MKHAIIVAALSAGFALGGCAMGQSDSSGQSGAGGAGGTSPSDTFMRLDTNQDNLISRQEAQSDSTLRFDQLDKNGDGVISPSEYTSGSQ
jgi:hypothetical protein